MVVGPRWSLRRARVLTGTKFLLVAGLVGYVLLALLVEQIAGLHGPISLGPVMALVMAAIPAVLWLAFFYLWDRHEPEPKHFVAGVTVLGALVAAPLADFLIYQAAPPQALTQPGVSPWSTDRLLHAIAVAGLAQELCKYAVVRYTVYMSREFDEPIDGVVYMMSAGTGVAVWINYHQLSGLGHSVILSTAAANAVVTTLAHASFAGALGYVMGRAKFSRRPAMARGALLLLGLVGAAVLNGQFGLVERWLTQSGLGLSPWKGVGYAAALAVCVFGVLMLFSQRLLRDSPHRRRRA
ncbi:MAG: PrsW family glutamic-type intramembrane protease [Kofleriaceae bacterium]